MRRRNRLPGRQEASTQRQEASTQRQEASTQRQEASTQRQEASTQRQERSAHPNSARSAGPEGQAEPAGRGTPRRAPRGGGGRYEGLRQGIDFNDPNRLGDTKNRDTVLGRLVQHFPKLNLRKDALSEPDMLGRAYEYLLERFADDTGKKGGEFYTPHKVVEQIVELLQPQEGMRICDPTCGSGGMLVQYATYVQKHGDREYDPVAHLHHRGASVLVKMTVPPSCSAAG